MKDNKFLAVPVIALCAAWIIANYKMTDTGSIFIIVLIAGLFCYACGLE